MTSAYVTRCVETYRTMRDAQHLRAEAWACDYETDLALFYSECETKVTYKSVMIAVAAELRAEKADARAELERWQQAERDHYSVYVDETVVDEVAVELPERFLTRYAAVIWSALQRRMTPAGRRSPVAASSMSDTSSTLPYARCSTSMQRTQLPSDPTELPPPTHTHGTICPRAGPGAVCLLNSPSPARLKGHLMFLAIFVAVAALVILGSLDSTPATRRPARSSGSIFDSPAKPRSTDSYSFGR